MGVSVHIWEITGDADYVEKDGSRYRVGMPLAKLVEQLGGYSGYLYDPSTGNKVAVSLESWKNRDPNQVWIHVGFLEAG